MSISPPQKQPLDVSSDPAPNAAHQGRGGLGSMPLLVLRAVPFESGDCGCSRGSLARPELLEECDVRNKGLPC
jgi:hypothetical protein